MGSSRSPARFSAAERADGWLRMCPDPAQKKYMSARLSAALGSAASMLHGLSRVIDGGPDRFWAAARNVTGPIRCVGRVVRSPSYDRVPRQGSSSYRRVRQRPSCPTKCIGFADSGGAQWIPFIERLEFTVAVRRTNKPQRLILIPASGLAASQALGRNADRTDPSTSRRRVDFSRGQFRHDRVCRLVRSACQSSSR